MIVAFENPLDTTTVGPPKKMNMHEEEIQLMEGQGGLDIWGNGVMGLVAVPEKLRKATEQAHHGQVDTALAHPNAGIDEISTFSAHDDIAIPEIAMEQTRPFCGRRVVIEEPFNAAGQWAEGIGGQFQEGLDSTVPPKGRPMGRSGYGGQGQSANKDGLVSTILPIKGSMKCGQLSG